MPGIDTTFAIVTPSYAPDFSRCQLLCESLSRHVHSPYTHYLVIDRKDAKLFQSLKGSKTELITVEECLPPWIFRFPFVKRWWMSLQSPPIRNWILQQIVKLSMAQHLKEDVLVNVDSDTAFIRPFDLHTLEKGDKLRLFRVPGGGNIPSHYKWHRTAGQLLGIPVQDYYGARYITEIVAWKRTVMEQLYQRIEAVHGKDWLHVLAWQWHLSEYILYGVFVDQVLKEQARHFHDSKNICLEYWETHDMKDEEIERFLDRLAPEHVAVMVSAKAGMSSERYRSLLEKARKRTLEKYGQDALLL